MEKEKAMPMMLPSHQQTAPGLLASRVCAHGRIIDDMLTKQGAETGKVRCAECGAVFDDPYIHKKEGREI